MRFKIANAARTRSKNIERYTVTDLAQELSVTRQTIYYWIKKGWVRPKRDYRNYPVFTKEDLSHIKKWHNSLREPPNPATKPAKNKTEKEPAPNLKWQDLQNSLYK